MLYQTELLANIKGWETRIEPVLLMSQISILPIKLFPQKRLGVESNYYYIDLQSTTLPLCYLKNN